RGAVALDHEAGRVVDREPPQEGAGAAQALQQQRLRLGHDDVVAGGVDDGARLGGVVVGVALGARRGFRAGNGHEERLLPLPPQRVDELVQRLGAARGEPARVVHVGRHAVAFRDGVRASAVNTAANGSVWLSPAKKVVSAMPCSRIHSSPTSTAPRRTVSDPKSGSSRSSPKRRTAPTVLTTMSAIVSTSAMSPASTHACSRRLWGGQICVATFGKYRGHTSTMCSRQLPKPKPVNHVPGNDSATMRHSTKRSFRVPLVTRCGFHSSTATDPAMPMATAAPPTIAPCFGRRAVNATYSASTGRATSRTSAVLDPVATIAAMEASAVTACRTRRRPLAMPHTAAHAATAKNSEAVLPLRKTPPDLAGSST